MQAYSDDHGSHERLDLPQTNPESDESESNRHTPLLRRQRSLNDLPFSHKDTADGSLSTSSPLLDLLDRFEASRAHETSAQGELDAAKRRWQQQSKVYRKSRALYEAALDPFRTQSDLKATEDKITGLRECLISDRSALESNGGDARRIANKLRKAKQHRERELVALIQTLRKWAQGLSDASAMSLVKLVPKTSEYQPGPIGAQASAASLADELLARYHDKAAEVESWGELLADQNYDYWNEVARRELKQDQEMELSMSESEFEHQARREKENITQELNQALQEAKGLREQYIAASDGSATQIQDLPKLVHAALEASEGDSSGGYKGSFQAALANIPAEIFENAEVVHADLPTDDNDSNPPAPASARIDSWVDSTMDDGTRSINV